MQDCGPFRLIMRLAVIATVMFVLMVHESVAFSTPSSSKAISRSPALGGRFGRLATPRGKQQRNEGFKQATTRLQMGYQLPPSPQGPLEKIGAILPTIATGVLVALFFASPLGGAIFAIFNSLFILAILTPFILYSGFQIWTALNTVEAPCPSCESLQVRVLKTGEPTVCMSCGSFVRANENKDGVELCNNPNDVMGGSDESLFDALFGGGNMGGKSDRQAPS